MRGDERHEDDVELRMTENVIGICYSSQQIVMVRADLRASFISSRHLDVRCETGLLTDRHDISFTPSRLIHLNIAASIIF